MLAANALRIAQRSARILPVRGMVLGGAQRAQDTTLTEQRRGVQYYKAPLRDMNFVLNEVLDAEKHYQDVGAEAADQDMIDAVMSECGKFCENVLFPLNVKGDQQGAVFKDGEVTSTPGFKEAYQQWIEGGWQGLSVPEEYGGQGLPMSMGVLKAELVGTANWSWGMFPGLSMGCMNTLILHGTEEQKQKYLTRLSSGEWLGTMCLTEPHCGTDLGQLRTKAEPQADGTYKLNGTKIFISCGDHDFTDNIIHIVLARLPDAPEGVKGISLFIVPKHVVNEDGSLQPERNVITAGIENKMGIKASPTCTMSFEDSVGYMIGEPNKGLHYMFTFMNTARLGTGLQGVGAAELAYQSSVPYARERISLRSLSGTKYPDQAADPLIVHPDIRRMLFTQRAFAEGGRAMLYYASMMGDWWMAADTDPKRAKEIDDYLGFHTPIVKGFLTEVGLEAAEHGVQIYGGHGYIKENEMEQIVRDARIATLYEGTTGIQALDLLGRKVMLSKGKHLWRYSRDILNETMGCLGDPVLRPYALALQKYTMKWVWLTMTTMAKAAKDKEVVNATCVDYLMYSGYTSMGYFWLRMAKAANAKIGSAEGVDKEFYQEKLDTANFYFEKLLPRAEGYYATAKNGAGAVTRAKDSDFNTY
eukprot:TRINITY_DN11057_c0_g2_i1.p2 TRINITY_DN11057_c0_g2~~TRINITY_DN11057_c0_g2_i1.p2  ORF type:complete len:643 (+),score=213.21 TRINITY_DN11057_c0_g2_i1:57-1985(+)